MSRGRAPRFLAFALLALALLEPGVARGAELEVLSAGAFRAALVAMAPDIERETGHRLHIETATAGGVAQRVRDGARLDLIVLPPGNAGTLGALIGPVRPLARVGIGVAVRDGVAVPVIATEDDVRAAVLAARAPAWIDPAAGGSSGIYLASLWERWGIAGQLKPKAVLVHGGLVSDAIVAGRADLGFQQLSELTGVPGVMVVGVLPASIQSYTVYGGAVPASSVEGAAADAVLAWLAGPRAGPALRLKGMDVP